MSNTFIKSVTMNQLHVFKRLFHYISHYKWRLFVIALVSLLGVAFEVAKPLPIKLVIDQVLSNRPIPSFLGNVSDKHQLLYICVAMMAIISIGSVLLTLLVFNLTIKIAQGLVFNLMVDF